MVFIVSKVTVSRGSKYFNFCVIFIMKIFKFISFFLNTKLKHKQVQSRHFRSHLHTPIGSSSNLLTNDLASALPPPGWGVGRLPQIALLQVNRKWES